MPSRTRKNVSVDAVGDERDAAAPPENGSGNSIAETSRLTDMSASAATADNGGKKPPSPKHAKPKGDSVQLFAFDAAQPREDDTGGGGRPRRRLKSIARFEPNSSDARAHCRVGMGFACPRCSAVCSYASRECEECGLGCCYEAGVGVVVLRDRGGGAAGPTGRDGRDWLAAPWKKSVGVGGDELSMEGANHSAPSAGTLTMQKVAMLTKRRRQSHPPQAKMESRVSTHKEKKKKSLPQGAKKNRGHRGERDAHLPSQPAVGLPEGWVARRFPRPSSGKTDPYWYSPQENFKFRSMPEAQCFIDCVGRTNGDESAALLLFKEHSRNRRSSTGEASQRKDNIADAERKGDTNQLARKEMDEAKMPVVEKTLSKMPPKEEIVGGQGPRCDLSAAATPNRARCAMPPFTRNRSLSCEEVGASLPHGNLSVSVQLYKHELQSETYETDFELESSDRKRSSRQVGPKCMPEKPREATDFDCEQGANNGVANLLHDKEAALREAETITELSNKVNGVTSLNSSLAKQDLECLSEDAENQIVRLTQQNQTTNERSENLQPSVGEMAEQKESQAAELQATINSLHTVRKEKDDLTNQLAELQTKHDAILSTSAVIQKSISDLQTTIEGNEVAISCSNSQISYLQKQLSLVSLERDELATEAESSAAELSSMHEEVSSHSSKIKELQSENNSIRIQCNAAEERVKELLYETRHSTETMTAMQAEKDELLLKLEDANAKFRILDKETELKLKKLETACAKKTNEIETLKQGASARMSQVYELTDHLSTALTEKAELAENLESTTADLSLMREKDETHMAKISQLESSIASLIKQRGATLSEKKEPAAKLESTSTNLSLMQNKTWSQTVKISQRDSSISSFTKQCDGTLSEKKELVAKLVSATADLALMRDKAASQAAKISQLESSAMSLTTQCDRANIRTETKPSNQEESLVAVTPLEAEKAEAVEKSDGSDKVVNELEGRIELLTADLNLCRTVSNELRAQIEAANAKCNASVLQHKDGLGELERIINMKDRVPPDIEAYIYRLEDNINQQNEEMQALSEAISASDAQTLDLITQVSTLTIERDELRAKVEEAAKEVSELQSTVGVFNTQRDTVEVRTQEQLSNVSNSAETLSAISSEKEALVEKVEECIARLDAEFEETQLEINDMKENAAQIQGLNGYYTKGTNASQLRMNEVLSQAEILEKRLTEEDVEVSKLLDHVEKLAAHMKKSFRKFKANSSLTTKDCKAKLKQKHKKIQALKDDIAHNKVQWKKKDWLPSSDSKDLKKPDTMDTPVGKARSTPLLDDKKSEEVVDSCYGEEGDGSMAGDVSHEDELNDGPLFAFDVTHEEYNWRRPKRKLKAIARFESMSFDSRAAHCKIGEGFICPRCSAACSYHSKECDRCQLKCYYEAGLGVVVLKERKGGVEWNTQIYRPNDKHTSEQKGRQSKSVLCHCQECNKRNLTMQGLISHYAKEHVGKPQWQKISYSCPFCPLKLRNSRSLGEVEDHVNSFHPGRRLLKLNTSKKSLKKSQVRGPKSVGVKGRSGSMTKDQGPPSRAWSKIEHVHVLPDGGKEYPHELPEVIDFIKMQCKKQEESVENTRGVWVELCKKEAEDEAKEVEEERLLYKRGIRERSRMADQERLEKLKYNETANEMMMRYEHQGGNKRRKIEDAEATKLCSRPIVFSDEEATRLVGHSGACIADECQFCKKDGVYRQKLLLEHGMNECKLGVLVTESPLIKKTTKVLSPFVRIIDDFYFSDTKRDCEMGEDPQKDEAIKRLSMEEDKLDQLKSAMHNLEFIKKYNEGFLGRSKDR